MENFLKRINKTNMAKKTHRIEIRLTEEEFQQAEVLREILNISNTELVKMSIRKLFEEQEDTDKDMFNLSYSINVILTKHKLLNKSMNTKENKKLTKLLNEFNEKLKKHQGNNINNINTK